MSEPSTFGSSRAGLFIEPERGVRGSNRTVVASDSSPTNEGQKNEVVRETAAKPKTPAKGKNQGPKPKK